MLQDNNQRLIVMKNSQKKTLQEQYKDLLNSYKKMTWVSIGSLLALTTTVVYNRYQVYRKKKIIDQKDNQIQNQKEELFHIRAHAKQVNKELADQYSIILKNLKKTIISDPSIQNIKHQINKPLEEINHALSNKIEAIKNFNYKKQMEKWYMSHLMGTNLQFQRLRRIQIVEAHWKNESPQPEQQGYSWRKGKPEKVLEKYQTEYSKLKQYIQRKNNYQAKGIQVNPNSNNLGETFGSNNALKIKYRCWGFDIQSGQFTIPLFFKIQQNEEAQCFIGQGQERYMECGDGWNRKQ